MSNEIDDRLECARKRVRTARKLEAMLREAQRISSVEQQRHAKLSEQVAEEQSDVENLQGLTLTGLFARVLGTREERLSQERQEYLAARLKAEQSLRTVEDAGEEVERLQDELARFAHADAEYGQLLLEKEKLILETRDDKAEALLALAEELADLRSDLEEYREAIRAGEAATNELRMVMSDLRGARNWGQWDLLGGGLVATLAKHSKIDSAKTHAHRAQHQLRNLQRELVDVNLSLNASLEIDGLSKFSDFFLDGLISDWVVQSKIKKSSEACLRALSHVGFVMNACRNALAETEKKIEGLGEKRVKLVEQR